MKVYVLSHGGSNPDYGYERDEMRVFASRDKARKVLAEMFKKDVADMTERYEEELYQVIDEPDKYFVEGDRRDALEAIIEEKEVEGE